MEGSPTDQGPTNNSVVLLDNFIFVISTIGLLTNIILVIFVARIKLLQTPFNIILCNLAAACICSLTRTVCFCALYWPEVPSDSAKVNFLLLFLINNNASGLFVTIIAIEQLLATFPSPKYSSFFKKKSCLAKVCAGTWIFAILGGLVKPLLELFNINRNTKIFVIVLFIVCFQLLFLIMNFVLYLCTLARLWRSPLASSSLQRRIMIKLVTTSIATIVSNAAVLVHAGLFWGFFELHDTAQLQVSRVVINAVNASITPIIYGYLRINLKKTVGELYSGCCCQASPKTAHRDTSRFHGRSANNALSVISPQMVTPQKDQVAPSCLDVDIEQPN